jgi:hypothetical protein
MPELLLKNAKPDSLTLILEQKLVAFKEFLSATTLLKEHLLSEDMEQIDSVIGHRQGLIRHIDNLDTRIKNMTMHPGTNRMGITSKKENQIEALSTALEETITKVITLNEECAAISTNRRDELEKELTGISNGRLALQGYAGGARNNGINRTHRFLSVNA